jgi:hypothetical protein
MVQVSFCCANSHGYLLDRREEDVTTLFEARDFAKDVIWSFINTAHPLDWRKCCLHVRDQNGKDIFVMPFAWALGRRRRFRSF